MEAYTEKIFKPEKNRYVLSSEICELMCVCIIEFWESIDKVWDMGISVCVYYRVLESIDKVWELKSLIAKNPRTDMFYRMRC